MAIVAALCTQCGANLQVDSNKEAAVCPFCNTAYIVEKAITNYNTTVTNNFSGATINIEGHNLDNLLKMANLSWESKDYKTALESCDKALMIDAENYRAWEIKAKCIGWVDSTLNTPKCREALTMAQKAISFAPINEKARISDELQTEVCLQILGLINIYSQMNSLGQVMHRPTFALLMSTYLEALEFCYVTDNTLEVNAMLIVEKLTTDNSFQEILFDGSIKDAQNEYNHGKKYIDEVKERQKRGMAENELNYWRDFPQTIIEKKEELLEILEADFELWKSVDKKHKELSEEYENVDAIVKQNRFKLFGEGAKLCKENKAKAHSIQAELDQIEDEYKKRMRTHEIIERKIAFLKSI